jgi:hypothetical protein
VGCSWSGFTRRKIAGSIETLTQVDQPKLPFWDDPRTRLRNVTADSAELLRRLLFATARTSGWIAQGEEILIHIRETKRTTVVLDFNHPLAAKTLKFDGWVSTGKIVHCTR